MTCYAIHCETVILAIGETPAEAFADFISECGNNFPQTVTISECTEEVFTKVQAVGGAISWDVDGNGALCLYEEGT